MLTLESAKMFVEHAPAAKPYTPGAPVAWTMADGHCICDGCASRVIGRGCDFTGVKPIWDGPSMCDVCRK